MIEYIRRPRSPLDPRGRAPIGAGSVLVPCAGRAGTSEIEVEFFRPEGVEAGSPFLFLVHGRERDADRYRDAWIPLAARQRRVLLAPRFSPESFPGSLAFNQGNVMDENGALRPRDLWSLWRLEEIFDALSPWFGNRATSYDLYGHSAGAQFVHRLVLLVPEARVRLAIAANAGWYTLPDFRARYPYGLLGTPADAESLRRSLHKRLHLLLGAEDTDVQDPTLRRLPREHEQGSNRLERGTLFFRRSAAVARKLGGGFGWRMAPVPGVDHDHVAMIPTVETLLGADAGESRTKGGAQEARCPRSRVKSRSSRWWRALGLGFLQGT